MDIKTHMSECSVTEKNWEAKMTSKEFKFMLSLIDELLEKKEYDTVHRLIKQAMDDDAPTKTVKKSDESKGKKK